MIAIKGMEMPDSCEECRFQGIEVEGGCALSKLFSIRRRGQKKPVWCPLVDLEIKQGHWQAWGDAMYAGGGYYKCTACGYRFSYAAFVDLDEHGYCPHCGAQMLDVDCGMCIHYEVCENASIYTDANECKHYKADDPVHTNPEDSIKEDNV